MSRLNGHAWEHGVFSPLTQFSVNAVINSRVIEYPPDLVISTDIIAVLGHFGKRENIVDTHSLSARWI